MKRNAEIEFFTKSSNIKGWANVVDHTYGVVHGCIDQIGVVPFIDFAIILYLHVRLIAPPITKNGDADIILEIFKAEGNDSGYTKSILSSPYLLLYISSFGDMIQTAQIS